MQAVLSSITHSLLEGCHDERCTASLCFTGRTNVSERPVRRYTARTARAIAISICTDPNLQRRMCQYGTKASTITESKAEDDPKDPSSFIQRLADSNVVRAATDSGSFSLVTSLAHDSKIARLTAGLNDIILAPETCELFASPTAESDARICELLLPYLRYLLEQVTIEDTESWAQLDLAATSQGLQYPRLTDPVSSYAPTLLRALDILNHQPYLHLLGMVVKLISLRASKWKSTTTFDSDITFVDLFLAHMAVDVGYSKKYIFTIWLKVLFLAHWTGNGQIAQHSICAGVLDLMRVRHKENGREDCNLFWLPVIAGRLNEMELVRPFVEGEDTPDEYHLLRFGLFFQDHQKVRYLRLLNHLKMRRAHSGSMMANLMDHRYIDDSTIVPWYIATAKESYFLLTIRRDRLLQDAFDQLWQREKVELARPLRVRLGEEALEIGHDLGGVQIEFYNLFCRQMLSDVSHMFVITDDLTGHSYFRPGSLQQLYMYELCGAYISLAVYNGVTLPVHFPLELYRIICRQRPPIDAVEAIDRIADAWPVTAKSMRAVLREDIDGLDFTYTLEANGILLSLLMVDAQDTFPLLSRTTWNVTDISGHNTSEVDINQLDWPGLRITSTDVAAQVVDASNKEKYVYAYCKWLTLNSIGPQLHAFMKGFHATNLFSDGSLEILGPELLQKLVEGEDYVDIGELRFAATYEGYEPDSDYIKAFWRIVGAWSQEQQKQLLKFVTAAERVPLGGASNLSFLIKKCTWMPEASLPTSSTCFRTLYLPEYAGGSAVLAEKLAIAVEYGAEGFGQV